MILNNIDRKMCFGICFFCGHLPGINFLQSTFTLSVSMFYLLLAIYGICNIVKPTSRIFSIGLYVIPSFIAFVPYWAGDGAIGKHNVWDIDVELKKWWCFMFIILLHAILSKYEFYIFIYQFYIFFLREFDNLLKFQKTHSLLKNYRNLVL